MRHTKTIIGVPCPPVFPTSAERRRAQELAEQDETRELPFLLTEERRINRMLPLISSGVFPMQPVTRNEIPPPPPASSLPVTLWCSR